MSWLDALCQGLHPLKRELLKLKENQWRHNLKETRIFLIPGHRAETFCLSAEEARELCIPIITLGIGCLKERVIHGETGFIASNEREFANLTLDLFRNDNLWSTFRKNLINIRGKYNWFKAAKNFISQIYK